jgi:hypothetical protein
MAIALVAVGLFGGGFMLYALFQWQAQPQPMRHRNAIGRATAIPPLDIFKLEPDGSLVWKGTAADLGSAELTVKVKVLAFDSHSEYAIYSLETRSGFSRSTPQHNFRDPHGGPFTDPGRNM